MIENTLSAVGADMLCDLSVVIVLFTVANMALILARFAS